jgi:predicted nucleic-acid-binding protein
LGWRALKVTADTNILIRAVLKDDARQAEAANRILREAEIVTVPIPALCEFVWVLSSGYKLPRPKIASAVRALLESANVVSDPRAVAAGLALLDAGGDFADGVIAFEGAALGGEVFASFDKGAVDRLSRQGVKTRLVE